MRLMNLLIYCCLQKKDTSLDTSEEKTNKLEDRAIGNV